MGPPYPHDPKTSASAELPRCVIPLVYMGTLTPEPRYGTAEPLADVHMYRCREHGVFRLTSKGLEPDE